jgi:phage terminase large subunit-like protein
VFAVHAKHDSNCCNQLQALFDSIYSKSRHWQDGMTGISQREMILRDHPDKMRKLSDSYAVALAFDWKFNARPNQLPPPGDWSYWLVLAGRGFGKSRMGAEWVRAMAKTSRHITIVGATANDARTIMVEGESGILAVCPPGERPKYMAHKGELHWPNGGKTQVMSADEPERFRGKQSEIIWADELASWRYPESWTQLMMGLRLGNPRAVITTTPRPTQIIRMLLDDPHTHMTRGSTYDNRSNLAEKFFEIVIKRYEGTRLGRQELNAEILTDNPSALWQRDQIEASRVMEAPTLKRVVVGVDPAATGGDESDLTGIVVAGIGIDNRGYVLGDYSLRASPDAWARKVVYAFEQHKADRIIVETNNGGEMCSTVLRHVAPNLPITTVHASTGKWARAEPIAALYEQGRVSHVGVFSEMEDQMTDYVPGTGRRSPDRMDALVWAMTHLMPPNPVSTASAARAPSKPWGVM